MKYYGKITDPKDLITLEKCKELVNDPKLLPLELTINSTHTYTESDRQGNIYYLNYGEELGICAGNTYNIIVDSVEYGSITAVQSECDNETITVGGTIDSDYNFIFTDYPFIICVSDDGYGYVTLVFPTAGEHTIVANQIGGKSKFSELSNMMVGYNYEKTGTLVDDEEFDNFTQISASLYISTGITPKMQGIISGNTYKVIWDGTEYNCTAFTEDGLIGLGNKGIMGGTSTGEPFLYMTEYSDWVQIYDVWGSTTGTSVYVTVTGTYNEFVKIDNDYLPNSNVQNGHAAYSVEENWGNYATGLYSHAEGRETNATNFQSHAEGYCTDSTGVSAHAEGDYTTASGRYSHAEGSDTTASSDYSHAEGYDTSATGEGAHSEGKGTEASGEYSHAEGRNSKATGIYCHAEGYDCTASIVTDASNPVVAGGSHAEGVETTASGIASHAEGRVTKASGSYSHAEGEYTEASSTDQHVQGIYNIKDSSDKYADIVGNGTSNTTRSNAETLDWNGNLWTAADVMTGGTDMDSPAHKLSTKITEPTTKSSGQYLKYNGSTWVAADVDALPSQTGQSGKYLTTDGSTASWTTIDLSSKISDPSTKSNGQYLKYNGSTWEAASIPAATSTTLGGVKLVLSGTELNIVTE